MRLLDGNLLYSPSDIQNHILCQHLTHLNLKMAYGELDRPVLYDRNLELIKERGLIFENNFLNKLKNSGYTVFDASPFKANKEIVEQAMAKGYDYIYQAYFNNGQWHGYADFLRKVDSPSNLGNWSYEVVDTKLSLNTKGGSVLQIALYSELIGLVQGIIPKYMHILNPSGEEQYKVNDYLAYLNLVKRQLLEFNKETITYPEPCNHCEICDWWTQCNATRRQDDHLTFVAGMQSSHINDWHQNNITTLTELAQLSDESIIKPKKGSKTTFQRLHRQAKLQIQSKEFGEIKYELCDFKNNSGLQLLPQPTDFDIYLDIKGSTFLGPTGLEYQFGYKEDGKVNITLINDKSKEKESFENLVDKIMSKNSENRNLHIYHFGNRTITALKRLSTQFGTKENDLDQLLRSETFVDLQRILKQALIVGVEQYTLKSLEVLYNHDRSIDSRRIAKLTDDFEYFIQCKRTDLITEDHSLYLQKSHEEDLHSIQKLHSFLENLRNDFIQQGNSLLRPELNTVKEPESVSEHIERITPLFNALMHGISQFREERNNEDQARYILAHFLDWYRREEKSFWWEYFRLLALQPEEQLDEKTVVSYLNYTGERIEIKKSVIDTYQYPPQENELKAGHQVKDENGESIGEIIEIDEKRRTIKLKKGPKIAENHPKSILKFELFLTKDKIESIVTFAEWVVENGFRNPSDKYNAIRSILLNDAPELLQPLDTKINNTLQQSIDWVSRLNRSYLPIQGPPGAGKSYTASRMILHLLKKGHKVGITALSHKVITNLLTKVKETADEEDFNFKALYKSSGTDRELIFWETPKSSADLVAKLSDYQLIAGTSFMWCKPELEESVDYLFVDEAGQYALIETLVVSKAAKNVILLGDHQQLKQPIQGLHPEGTEVSALEHILQGEATIPVEKGIFLAETWRMHPSICAFDSEMFYESLLKAVPDLINQRLNGETPLKGSGLFYHPVEHEGNTNYSVEEVATIVKIVDNLLNNNITYTNRNGVTKPLLEKDIKIITPYNSQVFELEKALPNIEIGTVDKFQGQEAPIVIYSMASSSPENAPRGMDFLYSPNRFNVAVSRAQIAFVLVGNPSLFRPNCRFPEQIKLANPFCKFYEKAKMIKLTL